MCLSIIFKNCRKTSRSTMLPNAGKLGSGAIWNSNCTTTEIGNIVDNLSRIFILEQQSFKIIGTGTLESAHDIRTHLKKYLCKIAVQPRWAMPGELLGCVTSVSPGDGSCAARQIIFSFSAPFIAAQLSSILSVQLAAILLVRCH